MTDTPIFIFSSGRCGSTLMQRILNSYDDITIWGEHNGFLRDIAEAFFMLLDKRDERYPKVLKPNDFQLNSMEDLIRFKDPTKWQGLLNGFGEQDVVDHFRALVKSMLTHPLIPQEHIWGFKEIRYGLDDRVIEFLHRLFPHAHFVFLVRNGLNTIASKSAKFYATPSGYKKLAMPIKISKGSMAWRKQYLQFQKWHVSGVLNSHWVAFEDMVNSLDVLIPLLAEIGKEMGIQQRQVLTMTEGRGASNKLNSKVNEHSHFLSYSQLVLAQWFLGDLNYALDYATPASVQWVSVLRKRLVGDLKLLESEKK